MYSVNSNNITMTRGDTLKCQLSIKREDGSDVELGEKDSLRFAMKMEYEDDKPALVKEIPTDTMLLRLESEDTKALAYGAYVYDIQLTLQDGTVDTFIKGKLKLTEEVL